MDHVLSVRLYMVIKKKVESENNKQNKTLMKNAACMHITRHIRQLTGSCSFNDRVVEKLLMTNVRRRIVVNLK